MIRKRNSYGQFIEDSTPILIRLVSKRKILTNGCWEWQGTIEEHGYGQVCLEGHNIYVHRLMAILCLGLDPKDKILQSLHNCDNKACFNPDHLYIGTHQDNVQDKFDRDKLGKVAKLSRNQVFKIKSRLAQGEKGSQLAREYNVSQATISMIKHGNRWSRLKETSNG